MIWIVLGCIPIVALLALIIAMMAADLGWRHAAAVFTISLVATAIVVAAALSIGYGVSQL